MNVVFLIGTSLRRAAVSAALEAGFDITGLLTPASERFDALREQLRAEHPGLPVHRVPKAEMSSTLDRLGPDAAICVGWPYLFPPELIQAHVLLNAHPTLLPKYRGPNAWYHIIANGEAEAGCTVHRLDEAMDAGPILHQRRIPLTPFDTYNSLCAQLVALEPETIVEALEALRDGTATFTPQDESDSSVYQKKRTPEDSVLDASRPLSELIDSIRACDADRFPAFVMHKGQKLCIRLWREDRPEEDHPESL